MEQQNKISHQSLISFLNISYFESTELAVILSHEEIELRFYIFGWRANQNISNFHIKTFECLKIIVWIILNPTMRLMKRLSGFREVCFLFLLRFLWPLNMTLCIILSENSIVIFLIHNRKVRQWQRKVETLIKMYSSFAISKLEKTHFVVNLKV